MIQKYKKTIIITSIITVCPVLLGLLWWNKLPDTIATHFGADNAANGWSSKPFAVFGIPFLMLAFHLMCIFMTAHDPKRRNIGGKMILVVLWLVPIMSLGANLCILCNAAGYGVDIGLVVNLLLGVVFLIIGNYLPKCKQNYSAGIKTAWTLNSEENWNRTHRLGGWLMMLAGVLFFINAFFQWPGMVAVVLILVMVPGIYSFALYKKGI